MWFEGRGVSVLAQLPISTRKVVQAKSFASTALSVMMPATLLVVSFFKPLTTFYSIVISIIEVGAVYASAYIATTLVCRLFGEGRMPFATFEGHLLQYIVVMIIGGIFVAAPVGVYAIAYSFLHYDHFYSTLAMGIAVALEVLLASAIARKALKD
jgi:predicted permease